jgi:hypothetical protein
VCHWNQCVRPDCDVPWGKTGPSKATRSIQTTGGECGDTRGCQQQQQQHHWQLYRARCQQRCWLGASCWTCCVKVAAQQAVLRAAPPPRPVRTPCARLAAKALRQGTPCIPSCALRSRSCAWHPLFAARRPMSRQQRTPLCSCTTSCTCVLQLRHHLRSRCPCMR